MPERKIQCFVLTHATALCDSGLRWAICKAVHQHQANPSAGHTQEAGLASKTTWL